MEQDSKQQKSPLWMIFIPWLIAALGILAGVSGQIISAYKDIKIKQYEVTFLEKRNSYSLLMSELNIYFKTALPGKEELHHASGKDLEDKLYALEPFLKPESRKIIVDEMEQIIFLINQHQEFIRNNKAVDPLLAIGYIGHRDKIRKILLAELFDL